MRTFTFNDFEVNTVMEQFDVTGADLIFHLLDGIGFEVALIRNIEATRNGSGSYYVELAEETVEVFI